MDRQVLAWVRVCNVLLTWPGTQGTTATGTTATVWAIDKGDSSDGRMFIKYAAVDRRSFAREIAEAVIRGQLEKFEREQRLYQFPELQAWGHGDPCELYAVVSRDGGELELVAPVDVEGVWAEASPPKTI